MSDQNAMDVPMGSAAEDADETGLGGDAEIEKTPHEGPEVNDMEADNAVEEETIETVDPENPPA